MADRENRIHPFIPKLVDQYEQRKVDRREFLRTSTLLGLSAATAYGIVGRIDGPGFVPQTRAQDATPKKGGIVRVSIRIPDLSTPHIFSWVYDSNSVRQCNDYLTRTGIDNITVPWLLENWEASDDLKTWTLRLRKDVKWSNGEPFVADHAIWNLKHMLDPATGSSVLGLFSGFLVEDKDTGQKDANGNPVMTTDYWDANAIEKKDDFTIVLNGKGPQMAVPENLFHYPAFMLWPEDNGKWGVGSPGTGPFEPAVIETGKRAVFKAREGYWGEGPYLDELHFIDHGDDASAQVAAMASRQADGMYEASVTQYEVLKQMPHLELYQVTSAQTGVARVHPIKPFDDARVRKALRLAIDTPKLLQLAHLNIGAPGEHHHVAPVHPEYADIGLMQQDIEGAKKLLADAGYENGIEAEISCKQDPAWELIAVQAMTEMWKQAGINVKINVMPSSAYWDNWTKVPFGFTAWTHRPLGVMVLGLAYRTGVPWNESHWSNKKFDELLAVAEGILDVEERRQAMVPIEELMLEEGPAVIPLWRGMFTFWDKKVGGFKQHPTSYIFGEELYLNEA